MKNVFSLLFLSSILLVGCEKIEDIESSEVETELNFDATSLLDRSLTNLNLSDATTVANIFRNKAFPVLTRSMEETTVVPVKSETGEDLLYVINYGNENGYVLVGATKNYQPILAYSDSGHFNAEEELQNENPFLGAYMEDISSVINIESDSLRMKYALKWEEYENPLKDTQANNMQPSSQDVAALKAQAISTYTNLGYECFNMSAVPYFIAPSPNDPNRAQNIINDICSHTHPAYDCMEDNLFLLKRDNIQINPLLVTDWNQYTYPYTVNGCWGSAPIAIAQIMNFYQWPAEINWQQITNPLNASNLTPFLDLMNTIGQAIHPYYYTVAFDGEDETYVLFNNVETGLNQLGYSFNSQQTEDLNNVYEPLRNGIPLLLWGVEHNSTRNNPQQMWICDGYRKNYREFSFMMFSFLNEYEFHRELIDLDDVYYHFNLCEKSTSGVGWYYGSDSINYRLFRIIQINPLR